MIALVACLLLAGCAEEAAGPQFANDPVPTRVPTRALAVATPAPLPTAPPLATPASIVELLRARGAPSNLFLVSGGAVWAVTSSGEATEVFAPPPASRILAIDSSPSAEQVAVVLESGSVANRETEVVIVDGAGEILSRMGGLAAGSATPGPENRVGTATVDWSPQGDHALVTLQGQSILELAVAGEEEPTRFDLEQGETTIVEPSWSPTGEAIAYIASGAQARERLLRVLDANEGSVADVVDPAAGRFVVEFAWMPDGVSLLFTEGGNLGGAVSGIDLWQVGADGENRKLVVSAGTVAPVAQITTVRPSPDGRTVAYAVLVPGASGPEVDSVWVRDLKSRIGFKIALPQIASVDDVWWTDRGLALLVTLESASLNQALLLVAHDGSASVLWAAPVSPATPVGATPAASPLAR